jgi:hypothetical protein
MTASNARIVSCLHEYATVEDWINPQYISLLCYFSEKLGWRACEI